MEGDGFRHVKGPPVELQVQAPKALPPGPLLTPLRGVVLLFFWKRSQDATSFMNSIALASEWWCQFFCHFCNTEGTFF